MTSERERFISMNLTFADVQPEQVFLITHVFCYSFYLFGFICYPFAVFIILTKSPKGMGFYKYLIIYQLSSAILLNITFLLTDPVILMPFWMVYLNGPMGYNYGFTKFFTVVIVFVVLLVIQSTVAQMFYRYLSPFADLTFIRVVINPPIYVTFMIVGLFGMVGLLLVPLVMVSPEGPKLQELVPVYPFLDNVLQKHPFLIGYFPDHAETIRLTVEVAFIGGMVQIPFLGLTILFLVLMLRRLKKKLQAQNYYLHAMLCRALFVQILLCAVFLMVAFDLVTGALYFQLKNGVILYCIARCLTSMHTVFDICAQMCMIKPYRHFIIKKFGIRQAILKKSPTAGTNTMGTKTPSGAASASTESALKINTRTKTVAGWT